VRCRVTTATLIDAVAARNVMSGTVPCSDCQNRQVGHRHRVDQAIDVRDTVSESMRALAEAEVQHVPFPEGPATISLGTEQGGGKTGTSYGQRRPEPSAWKHLQANWLLPCWRCFVRKYDFWAGLLGSPVFSFRGTLAGRRGARVHTLFMPALARTQTSVRLKDPWQFDRRWSGLRPCG